MTALPITLPITVPITLSAVLGLVVGSFLNVVIARVPAGRSVVTPSSRCPRCDTPIAARDNVPVLSWLILRGRSRCCGSPISRRYPLVEAGTALALVAVTGWVATRPGAPDWPLGALPATSPAGMLAWTAMAYLAVVTIVLALIDIDVRRLPTAIVVPSWWVGGITLGGAALLAGNRDAAVRMLVGGLALWGLYRLLHLVYPAGMGYGDVRLAGLIGGYLAWLGWAPLLVGAFGGFLLGAVGGALVMLAVGGGRKTTIPYGPYLLAAAWVGLLWGEPIARTYLRLTGLA